MKKSELVQYRDSILGIVDVGSTVNKLKVQITNRALHLEIGRVIWVSYGEKHIYYQITEGVTSEDNLKDSNKYGYVAAHATQLGTWDEKALRFIRQKWVPELNTVAFNYDREPNYDVVRSKLEKDQFLVGFVPHTNFPVTADIPSLVQYHYSVLGITGCGKTTFEMDIVEKKVELGHKVLCFDITGDYAATFAEKGWSCIPFVSPEQYEKLTKDIIRLESLNSSTPYYRNQAAEEIQACENAIASILNECVTSFFSGDGTLFLIEIEELANVTNTHDFFYRVLNHLFAYKKSVANDDLVSIVFEEAHTIVPEKSASTVDYWEAERFVGKISQITLQERKYRIGFTIITQRTANVAKTILNQCNTVFSFACFDRTAIDFLANYYGQEYAMTLPNLGAYQVLAAGKAVNSDLPVIAQIPEKIGDNLVDILEARRKYKTASVQLEDTTPPEEVGAEPEDDDLPF